MERKLFYLGVACFGWLTACLFFLQLRSWLNLVYSPYGVGLHVPYNLCYAVLFFTFCLIACAGVGIAGLYQLFTDDAGAVGKAAGTPKGSPQFTAASTSGRPKPSGGCQPPETPQANEVTYT